MEQINACVRCAIEINVFIYIKEFALVISITTVGSNLCVGIDNNINTFSIQYHMISSSLQARRKKNFRLIASFTWSSSQPSLFYALQKKNIGRKENSIAAGKSVLMETQTELLLIPFFFLLSFLNNNKFNFATRQSRDREKKREKQSSILKILKIHKRRKKERVRRFEFVCLTVLLYDIINTKSFSANLLEYKYFSFLTVVQQSVCISVYIDV
jgi:hypothetical protein